MKREIFVVHRHDPRNIGDMATAATQYIYAFPWLANATTIDIEYDIDEYADRLREANVILGGGGLLGNDFFGRQVRQLIALQPPRLVVWGAGHNNHDSHFIEQPDYLAAIKVVGLRDYIANPYEWVPCPSAMIPALSQPPDPWHDVVVYRHWDDNLAGLLAEDQGVPTLTNNHTNLLETLTFLASGKTVVTNSYHGAYWATLMGRRVIVVSPFSSKFNGLAYQVPQVLEGDWHDWLNETVVYPEALDECRSINLEFAERVRAYFEM